MDLKIEKMPFGTRPNKYMPNQELYRYLGEKGVRQMVSDHYDLLASSSIKSLFPPDKEGLEEAKKRSADFFIQRLGGPEYFNQNRGSPMLVRRHAPFQITPNARLVWLACYRNVIINIDAPEHLIISFWNFLHDFSNWMVNTPEHSTSHKK